MNPMRLVAFVLFAACLNAAPPLYRLGDDWIQVTSGVLPQSASGRLKIDTRGAVVIRGAAGTEIRYILRARVQASAASEALRRLSGVQVRARDTRASSEITLAHSVGPMLLTDLEVYAPVGLRQINIHTQGGNIEAYDLNGAIEAASAGGRIQMDRIGGDATTRTGGGNVRFGVMRGGVRCLSAGGSIKVNHVGGESWFETAGGEIYIGESRGPVHASTAGGNILVEKAGSTVGAQTAGGRIEVHQASGIVTAENSSGSIQVGDATGVRCESSSGLIRLRGASGSLHAITNFGSILAELISSRPLQDSILSTASGDITVVIPANMPLTVRASSENGMTGRIVSEFPEIAVRLLSAQQSGAVLAEGALNGGGPILQLSAVRGTIYLRRQR